MNLFRMGWDAAVMIVDTSIASFFDFVARLPNAIDGTILR